MIIPCYNILVLSEINKILTDPMRRALVSRSELIHLLSKAYSRIITLEQSKQQGGGGSDGNKAELLPDAE